MSHVITIFDAITHDPYPLGVPERVRKEIEEIFDGRWDKSGIDPVFHIDCECMSSDDVLGARSLLDTFLVSHGVDKDLIDVLIAHAGSVALSTPGLKWIEIGWGYELGWHIKLARMVDTLADPDFREVGTAAHRAILGS